MAKTALALGKKHRLSEDKLRTAALLHDCAKYYSRTQFFRAAKKLGLKFDPVKRLEPKLFHAEVSAALAKNEFGVRNTAVLKAIKRHTTGAPGMSKLEKVIYLADHIEEGRDFDGVKKLRALAFRDLDKAIAASASKTLDFLIKSNLPIHPETVATRNYYL